MTLINKSHHELPFEIEIVQPHPYFRVDPCFGSLKGNESMVISITYGPITFGSSAMILRLNIKRIHCNPQDCVVSACAVSGLLEKEALVQSQAKVHQYLSNLSNKTNHNLTLTGNTSYSTMKF